jgi:alpha-mannosidase
VLTKGLPEYEVRLGEGGAELCLTLLRCVGTISRPNGLATRPRTAGPQVPTPEGQCLGHHECEYALLPAADALYDLALLRESQDYRWGLPTVDARISLEPPIRLEGDVVFSCLKGAEDGDGLILRCFNPTDSPVEIRVIGDVSASRSRLDETGDETLRDGATQVAGYQIVTLRLRPR